MKKLQFMAWPKLCTAVLLGTAALFTASCATDGYDDDEKWESNVSNTQMVSPAADNIDIVPSSDGMSMTIKWPVVLGAGGYQVTLKDVSDPANPMTIYTGTVDGCSVESLPREEDMKYRLEIKTLGNTSQGNTDAPSATVKEFSTATATTATIPAGNLAEWFNANPLPDSEEMLYYDLEAGGSYTLDTQLDFKGHMVTLRSQSKNNRAKVKVSADGQFAIDHGFGLKYINFDCSQAAAKAVITTSSELTIAKDAKSFYIVEDPVTIQNCDFADFQNSFISPAKVDDNSRICIKTFLLNNCILRLKTSEALSGKGVIDMYTCRGFINTLTIQNSTIYNTTANDPKYFVQYENNMNCNQLENKLGNSYVTFEKNTFYNVCKGQQMANWSGIGNKGVTYYTIKSNIFVDCGNKQVARRLIVNKNNAGMNFNYNTYYFDNGDASSSENAFDNGTILTSDPGFADAANGDFTISGSEQLKEKTGDPRWIK